MPDSNFTIQIAEDTPQPQNEIVLPSAGRDAPVTTSSSEPREEIMAQKHKGDIFLTCYALMNKKDIVDVLVYRYIILHTKTHHPPHVLLHDSLLLSNLFTTNGPKTSAVCVLCNCIYNLSPLCILWLKVMLVWSCQLVCRSGLSQNVNI